MKPKYIAIIIAILVIPLTVWYFRESDNQNVVDDLPANNQNSSDTEVEEIENTIQGLLQMSNDKKRGNLMVITSADNRTIYLNTSRDFSNLIGKQVVVTIDGSLDDFRLVDIRAR